MKTRTKTLVVVEIAIVLCSLFLVAIPAIAADQTTQKVGASTITTTADRPTYEHTDLDVFGNANEDETIDMRDTTYIKLLIFGKKPKTDLADANYDGKVSMLDVGQTKLIILGKEGKLTFVDIFGEAVTVNKPIKRLVNLGTFGIEVTRFIGAKDILLPVVGWDRSNFYPTFFPEFSKWPSVGYKPDNCDFEKILSLKPDAVQTNLERVGLVASGGIEHKRVFEEKLPGIPIICLNMREPYALSENVRTYGYILDRENEAEEFIDWIEGHLNMFKAKTEGLSENEKPRGCMGFRIYKFAASGDGYAQAFLLAGGRNIIDEIVGPDSPQYRSYDVVVDPEWVIEQNPEYIFIADYRTLNGYETDDPSEMAALRQEIMDRPELANVDAVKNGHVHIVSDCILGGAGNSIIGAYYMAKLLQPDLFEDVDLRAVHQEYIDKFCHVDFNVKEHGVFMYPPPEESR